jgi:hypothetical protein
MIPMPTIPPFPAPPANFADTARWSRENEAWWRATVASLPTLADYRDDPARPMPMAGDRRTVPIPPAFVERLVGACLSRGVPANTPVWHTGYTTDHWGTSAGPFPAYRISDRFPASGWTFILGEHSVRMSHMGHVYLTSGTSPEVRIDEH